MFNILHKSTVLTIMTLGITLSACGGGKGCAVTSNPRAGRDIYEENVDINLGVIDGSHVKDGRLVIRTTIPEDAKQKLRTYFDRASQEEGFEEQLAHLAIVALVRKSEAALPFGSPDVKSWTEYFCSDVRYFHVVNEQKTYLGAQGDVIKFDKNLRGASNFPSEQLSSPPPARYDIRDVFPDFYEGNFDIQIEGGTVLLPEDMKSEEILFRIQMYTTTSTYDGGNVFDKPDWPMESPLCGPYAPDADMGMDMMPAPDMAGADMNSDMAVTSDMGGDMAVDMLGDMAQKSDMADLGM